MRTITALFCLTAFLCACSSSDDPKPDTGPTVDTGPGTDTGPDKDTGPEKDTGPGDDAEVPFDCTGQDDGTACGGDGVICLKEKCVTSACGDAFVDEANGEECDEDSEGCSDCKYLCKEDADCDDGESCNGTETCDKTAHKCAAGTAEADGTSCGTDKVCNGGACSPAGCGNKIKDGTEECDDGNKDDGDGCDNDCTFSCNEDADCNDGDACNGEETCKKEADKQACEAGTALDCDDKKDCTTDSCDALQGCLNTPIDADGDKHSCDEDCDDTNPVVFKGAPECADGIDNDCDGDKDEAPLSNGKCWVDKDKDGYAALNATMISNCICPDGYTNVDPTTNDNDDCWDSVRSPAGDVNPDQTEYRDYGYCTGIMTIGTGKCSKPLKYDWNCDGAETQLWKYLASNLGCKKAGKFGKLPCIGYGWSTTIPACGVEAKFTKCTYDKAGDICLKSEVLQKQKCR